MPVYFIRAGEDGPVKIGYADNVANRLRALQTAHYEELRIIRRIDGGMAEEKWLHRHFERLHIRAEWFEFDSAMLAVVPKVQPAPEAPPTKLALYLAETGLSVPKFAKQAGLSAEGVRLILKGKRLARRTTAERIKEATGGAVTATDLLSEAA